MREMALMDERARIQFGINEGLAKGLEKGREEGLTEGLNKAKLEIARNALVEGLSIEFIQKITGLSAESIKDLNK